jgi:hypothetical protein
MFMVGNIAARRGVGAVMTRRKALHVKRSG